jgi:hypothetical protein
MKAICIKSKIFDFGTKYGGSSFKVESGKVYEYTKDNFDPDEMHKIDYKTYSFSEWVKRYINDKK